METDLQIIRQLGLYSKRRNARVLIFRIVYNYNEECDDTDDVFLLLYSSFHLYPRR